MARYRKIILPSLLLVLCILVFRPTRARNAPKTGMSVVLTARQVVEEFASDRDVPLEDAAKELGINLLERSSDTYRTITSSFYVTADYQPSAKFYCLTSESGWFRGIIKILNSGICHSAKDKSKQFVGSFYANLEDPNRIFYTVNGDFYDEIPPHLNINLDIGTGDEATLKLRSANLLKFSTYMYIEKRVSF